jgi:DNA polymerase elongation subunit (family B)
MEFCMQIELLEQMDFSTLSDTDLLKLSKQVKEKADNECFSIGMQYNKQDVNIVENLDKKLNFIKVALTMTYMAKVKHKDIFGQVRFWDTYLYNFTHGKNKQIPPETRIDDIGGFAGAFVKEPRPGRYKWIVSFDLNSLYPSIMMQYNMSPETLIRRATGNYVEDMIKFNVDTRYLKDKNITMVANGAQFRKDKWGFIPEIVDFLYTERRTVKNKMLQSESESELIKTELENRSKDIVVNFENLSVTELKEKYKANRDEEASLNAYQMALKISLNSLYGACGNTHFRYFSIDIAEGITLTGQMTIKYISEKLNLLLNKQFDTTNVDYVIANDTDSAYLYLDDNIEKLLPKGISVQKVVDFVDKFCSRIVEPYIDKSFEELADYLNAYENKMKMKRESIADMGAWRAKKNYILQVWDNEGVRYDKPKLKAVGVETARSSTPNKIKPAITEFYKLFLNEDEETCQKFIRKFRDEFFELALEDIAFPKGVNDIDKWYNNNMDGWRTGTPIHVKASISYNNNLRKYKLDNDFPIIKNGDKIKFIYLKIPNPVANNAIAFHDDLHEIMKLSSFVDKELQFEKTFLGPVNSFLKLVNWTPEKQNNLLDLFG